MCDKTTHREGVHGDERIYFTLKTKQSYTYAITDKEEKKITSKVRDVTYIYCCRKNPHSST